MSLLPAFQVDVLNPAFGFVLICILLLWSLICNCAGDDKTSPAYDLTMCGIVILLIVLAAELLHLILIAGGATPW